MSPLTFNWNFYKQEWGFSHVLHCNDDFQDWVSQSRVSRGCTQALLGGAKQLGKQQWTETDAHEVPSEHEEKLLYCSVDWALGEVAQTGCEVSPTGDIQEQSGCNSCAMCSQMCLSMEAGPDDHCGAFRPCPFCFSVTKYLECAVGGPAFVCGQ